MRSITFFLFFILAIQLAWSQTKAYQKITFPSQDGLMLTADLYMPHPKTAPFILLFHQAGWSRGEYREIAPQLNEMGFNCLAVDQRSGGEINGIKNESYALAREEGKKTRYRDAKPDLEAAIARAKKYYAQGKLIIWGSSYSATIALQLMGEQPDLADAALAFAPGTYFPIQAEKITRPVFITSAQKEKANWWDVYAKIPAKEKAHFLPETEGNHGSRALWSQFPDSEAYWEAVSTFLEKVKNL